MERRTEYNREEFFENLLSFEPRYSIKPASKHQSIASEMGFRSYNEESLNNRQFIDTVVLALNVWGNFMYATREQHLAVKYLTYCHTDNFYKPVASFDPETRLASAYQSGMRISSAICQLLGQGIGESNSAGMFEYNFGISTKDYGFDVIEAKEADILDCPDGYRLSILSDNRSKDVRTRYEEKADRLGIPPRLWHRPAVLQYVGLILGTESLREKCQDTLTEPDIEPRKGPRVADRYHAAVGFAEFAQTILERGILAEPIGQDELIGMLIPGLRLYGYGLKRILQPPPRSCPV
jgi:hypothetical protein